MKNFKRFSNPQKRIHVFHIVIIIMKFYSKTFRPNKMKKIHILFLFLCISTFTFQSCLSDECTEQLEYTQFNPVYMKASEFRINSIEQENIKALENPGKMYFYENYLFINEKGEGVHIYNNENKENPFFVTFYKIPGNFDIVIKDGHLVADNVIDLITIDITDINSPEIIDRIKDYKSHYTNWEDQPDRLYWAYSIPSTVKQIINCSDDNFGRQNFWRGDVFFTTDANVEVFNNGSTASNGGSSVSGIGGSTSRFTLVNDYLYIVSDYNLLSFTFKSGETPELVHTSNIGWGIETIYPFKNTLFIGSQSGMFIYSLDNPAAPSKISTFEHARACDPVVVKDDRAYVTLRDGRTCEGFSNQLDVIDVSNLSNPTLIKSYSMKNPNGMAIDGNRLFLSESAYGIKVLDISNDNKVTELAWDKSISSSDLIYLGNNHLMSIGADGFHQFDVSDNKNLKEISYIPVQ